MCSPQFGNVDLSPQTPGKGTLQDDATIRAQENAKEHPTYWFDDATLILTVQDQLYKIHQSLVTRLSPFIKSVVDLNRIVVNGHQHDSTRDAKRRQLHVDVEASRGVLSSDVEVLLGVIYHDISPASDALSFPQVAALVRVSSPKQLDFPAIHSLGVKLLAKLIPTEIPATSYYQSYFTDALGLAIEYQISEIKKPLLYSLMTTSNESDVPLAREDKGVQTTLIINDAINGLMEQAVNYFSPVLFTPAVGSHMQCTDAFAEHWMNMVIAPSIQDSGVVRPIESLEWMKSLAWKEAGICGTCMKEKEEEWTEEQEKIWKLVDEWIKDLI